MVPRIVFLFVATWLALLPAQLSASPAGVSLAHERVRVCPASDAGPGERQPDFAAPRCRTQVLWRVDPQGRELWAELRFDPGAALLASDEPLGLFLNAKASSAIWLNGRTLGVNGVPGDSAADEVPGRMDTVFFVPATALREGENRLVLHLSAMHGSMQLANPVHNLVLAPYRSAGERALAFLPAMVTFGLFLAGVAYFGMSAWRGYDREGSAILAAASLAAALQLAAESTRGIISYPYPWHELRLVLILLFAALLALALLTYLLLALFPDRRAGRWWAVGGAVPAMAVAAWLVAGFDGKTVSVLLVSAAGGMAAGVVAWRRGNRTGGWTALGLLGLMAAIYVAGGRFLDLDLYLALGALVLVLFARQAQAVARERAERQSEAARARDLARALARAEDAQGQQFIEVTQGNRTSFVSPDEIARFAGAGDYVEAHWGDGQTGLFAGSLAGLEDVLPPGFIRTHRSHIVNAAHVRALDRDAVGTGRLILRDGSEVPVSRRIMPAVRKRLG